jgi:mannose-6-phosphate isomerase-like protein (cupin superfamily)
MTAIGKVKKVDKEWGYELWLANNEEENYCGKILYVKSGHSSSMHYHAKKHETFYVLEGTLNVELIDTDTTEKTILTLEVGDTYVIDRHKPHRLFPSDTSDGVKFIEISTLHEDSDSYRVYREPVKEFSTT